MNITYLELLESTKETLMKTKEGYICNAAIRVLNNNNPVLDDKEYSKLNKLLVSNYPQFVNWITLKGDQFNKENGLNEYSWGRAWPLKTKQYRLYELSMEIARIKNTQPKTIQESNEI